MGKRRGRRRQDVETPKNNGAREETLTNAPPALEEDLSQIYFLLVNSFLDEVRAFTFGLRPADPRRYLATRYRSWSGPLMIPEFLDYKILRVIENEAEIELQLVPTSTIGIRTAIGRLKIERDDAGRVGVVPLWYPTPTT